MPPTNIAKVTLFFGDGRYGWSETYYNTIPSTSNNKLVGREALWGLYPLAFQLARARANMLPGATGSCQFNSSGRTTSTPELEYVRMSQVGVPRNTAFFDPQSGEIISNNLVPQNIATAYARNDFSLDGVTPDNPYSCIEMECSLNNGLTSKRALGGLPDEMVCDQGWGGSTTWYQLWKAFAAILVNQGWGVLSNSIQANGVNLAGAQAIQNITQDSNYGRPIITIGSPLSFPTDSTGCPDLRVQIFCYRSAPGRWPNLNGVHRLVSPGVSTSAGTTVFTLSRTYPPINPATYGSVIPYAGPSFATIVAATLTRTVNRKRGRPFDLPRGRRSVTR